MRKMYTKSETLWHKIYINDSFNGLIALYREELHIPDDGHQIKNEKERLKLFKKIVLPKNNLIKINIFLNLLEDLLRDKHILEKFKFALIDYLLFNRHDKFKNIDLSGCSYFWISGNKGKNVKLEKGIYIKIGENLGTFEDIQNFIKNQKSEFEFFHKKLFKNKKPRIRESRYWLRDAYIYQLSRRPKKELCEEADRDITSEISKDDLMGAIFKKKGWGDIGPENVRKIISRQKQLIEKDFVTFN